MAKLTYSARDILQKEFKTKVRGYDSIEVDEFLDNVIKDYEAYNQEIGESIAFENAFDKLWQLEGYVLKNKLAGF